MFPVLSANTLSTGYNINNSLRFRASASASLSRTPSSAGNLSTWTWSAWVKRGTLSSGYQVLFMGGNTVTDTTLSIYFSPSDTLGIQGYNTAYYVSSQVFRDPSAWYHIVVALDTTQATQSNRCKVYVNGSLISASTNAFPLNGTWLLNSNVVQYIGNQSVAWGFNAFDGYMTEINFVNAQQLTPSSFGSTNATTGVWQPAKYTGTYGTNGFYLNFSDIATTSGSNAGLGKDFSGNTNYWNTNNISVTAGVTYDAMTDSPTLTSATVANYAVLNPLDTGANTTISDGNLKYVTSSNAAVGTCRGTFGVTSGKYYFEITAGSTANANTVGVANLSMNVTTGLGDNANGWGYTGDGFLYNNGAGTNTSTTWGNGDVIGIAFDADTGRLWFAKNNTWVLSGNPSSNTNPAFTGLTGTTFFPAVSDFGGASTSNLVANFGQRPFSYTPPSGFVALNTFNLPDSTIKKGNTVMDATLVTATGTTQTVTNAGGFKPDLLIVKTRAVTGDNNVIDSVRGVSNYLITNQTVAELTASTFITSFNSNGWTFGTGNYANGTSLIGWQWQAGQGSTSSNTSGTITSTVSVNATAGFSIVTYTAQSSGTGTVGHGLGVAPRMIITKERVTAPSNWSTYHQSIGNTKYFLLNTTNAAITASAVWNNTSPTSSVFTLGSAFAGAGTMVAYCWAEIAGFSKFTSYIGNNSADGPFVYCGFRPKFVMIKDANTAGSWVIFDSTRATYNAIAPFLQPQSAAAEVASANQLDFLSNGIKLRANNANSGQNNVSGNTYIVMAFAENPFKNALAR